MIDELQEILSRYGLNADEYIGSRIITNGHINHTYALYFDLGNRVKRYLLQEINTYVFRNPDELMENIQRVSDYCHGVLKKAKIPNYHNLSLRLCHATDGSSYIRTASGKCFRIYHYIEGGVSFTSADDPKLFYSSGQAIGFFQNMLADFPINTLHETIPYFHNTPKRYEAFAEILKDAPQDKIDVSKDEIDFIVKHKGIAYSIQPLIDNGTLPLRVVHNDGKISNIMFDYNTHSPLCMIDLDTVMPGSSVVDYGDFVRGSCNLGAEDSKNPDDVKLSVEHLEDFTKGYLTSVSSSITQSEVDHLIDGAILMCYELGMRFLHDYLSGDHYFQAKYPGHNLVRARAQLRLCQEILNRKEMLEAKVQEIYKTVKR